MTPRWWVIHDEVLRAALEDVERADVSAAEVYARMCEHADHASVGWGESRTRRAWRMSRELADAITGRRR